MPLPAASVPVQLQTVKPYSEVTMNTLIQSLAPLVKKSCPAGPCIIFLSATDMKRRALVRHAAGTTPGEAWEKAQALLQEALAKASCEPAVLRADWVVAAARVAFSEFKSQVEQTRRNYFRKGLALDESFDMAFTEMELNANAMLYKAGENHMGQVNLKNCSVYCKNRFKKDFPNIALDEMVVLFATNGAFVEKDAEPLYLSTQEQSLGRRNVPAHTPELFRQQAFKAASYLAQQCRSDGRFAYGYFSCFDRSISAYNTLRHLSSTWSLAEAFGEFKTQAFKDAILRSLDYSLKNFLRERGDASFFEDCESRELKLGSNGCALILLAKLTEITKTKRYIPLMRKLANGIIAMQESNGGFVHVLNSKDFSVKERNRVVYYDGEAVFGLLRCYSITHDSRLLESAQKAFSYFIETEHWKYHDHWLAYAVNEMTRIFPDERYFAFGIDNFKGYLNFIANRETAYPTLLELMLAADAMIRRLQGIPALRHLLHAVPLDRFEDAMRKRAEHLLDGLFWPEFAMFFKNPARIVNSFFVKHHAFRVRIDDVQHFLSSFIGYARWLEKPSLNFVPYYRIDFPQSALESTPGRCWDAAQLAEAAGGVWLAPPPRGWHANGIVSSSGYLPHVEAPAVFAASCAEHLAKHLRIRKMTGWDSHAVLEKLWKRFAGAIVERKIDGIPETFPQLLVKDGFQSLIELGIAARKRFQGTVIGVTGSAGKTTTCEMLRHVLEQDGSVFATYASHNNKIGVASVFASIRREIDFAVLEMSIPAFDMLGGSVSRYIPPHIAVVTQISAAHLQQWKSMETIAKMKCRIFDGMSPGGHAILNRDMEWYGFFARSAHAHGLTVLDYGTDSQSQVRLLSCGKNGMEIFFNGKACHMPLSHPAMHRAMNACAVIGVLLALGLDIEEHAERIASFKPIAGRGTVEACIYHGKMFTIIDESYNANPASMLAAIEAMAVERTEADVLLLGDMRELGEKSREYHCSLAEAILKLNPSRVLLCGNEMKALWHEIGGLLPGCWFKDAESVCAEIDAWIQEGDRLLVKSSHGTGLWQVVQFLKANMRTGNGGADFRSLP